MAKTTRSTGDYVVDRDTLERAVSRTKLPKETIIALAALGTQARMPGGDASVEVNLPTLRNGGMSLDPSSEELPGYSLFRAAFKADAEKAVLNSRFFAWHLSGAHYRSTGAASPQAFLRIVDGNTSQHFQSYVTYLTAHDYLPLLAAKDWLTFAERYAAANTLSGMPFPPGWAVRVAAYLTSFA